MQDYRQLKVWSQSHALVLSVYSATVAFPKTELYGLASQLRRAAVSVPSNIAEGASRSSGNDFARFLEIARGSLGEVEYQLLLAHDLGYIERERSIRLGELVDEVGGMLTNLVRSVRRRQSATRD